MQKYHLGTVIWHSYIWLLLFRNVPPLLLVYRFRSSSSGLSTPNHDFLNSGGQSTIIDGPRLPVQIFSIVSYILVSSRCNISTLVRSFHTDCTCMELSAADLNRKQSWAQFSILAVCHQVSVLSFAFSQCSSHDMVSSTESTVIYWWNTVPVVCLVFD